MDPNNYVAAAPGGGFVAVVNGKQIGTFQNQGDAENAYNGANGPTSAPSAPASAGGISISDMTAQLRSAGYNGPWDDASVTAAYNRTVNGGNAGAATGGPEGFNSNYYQLIQAGIDATVKNALAAGGLSLDAAKAAADNIRNLISTYGDQAYQYLAKAGELGVSVADVMSRLNGPSNAFAYDRAATAFRGNGLGDSVQALTSGFVAPKFGAMGPTTPQTLSTVGNDVAGNGGTTGGSGSVIDQLLGLAGTAEQGYQNASNGKTPFSIPQFDANGKMIPGTGSTTNQASSAAGASDGMYQTSNGPKTLDQMLSELDVAAGGHWDGGDRTSATAIASAYAHTTGGTVTPPQVSTTPSTPATSSAPVMTDQPATLAPSLGKQTATTSGAFSVPPTTIPGLGDITQSGGPSSFGTGFTPYVGSQAYLNQYGPDAQSYLQSLPDPNFVNPKAYAGQSDYSKQLELAGFGAKGYDPNQLSQMFGDELPQSSAGPKFGLVG